MDKFAVTLMPVQDVEGWRTFCEEVETGDRAADHKDFLRRAGITAEHIFHQPTPMGDLMVLIWEGIDQAAAAAHMEGLVESPQSGHEHYLRDHVIPQLHGVDLSQPPPPPGKHVLSITV
jgi:hypothetical protein